MKTPLDWFYFVAAWALMAASTFAQSNPRARDLGVPFEGTPGPLDAITDVKGVEVGHTTLIYGSGKLVVGQGPVRTGVTAVLPRGKSPASQVFAGWFSLNGNGEMTGTTWVEESGFLQGPVMITNTHSVGVVRDAVIKWRVSMALAQDKGFWWGLPVVAETYDGYLNDVNGFHVTTEDAIQAINTAHSGSVEEGNVGGGTGMSCYEFKGGIGTASRQFATAGDSYTVGVLVQCNCGRRELLRIAGAPIGMEIPREATRGGLDLPPDAERGSIIIVVATDAPLLPTQLKRLARRASLGLARTGSVSSNGSGDIFIAFSTANPGAAQPAGISEVKMMANDDMSAVFAATVQATEESIVNAMVAARTMTGVDNHTVTALPHDRLEQILKKYNRLANPALPSGH